MKRTYEMRIYELEHNQIKAIEKSANAVIGEMADESAYDVFVSHAWEDKESFVDEFVQCLYDRDVKVWYDKDRIKWGDSMRARIDAGLRKSKFGVAVLSPDYISEGKYWTKAELDGLFQLESINGKKLLPIWHNLTKKQVMEFSPILASKLAMTTASIGILMCSEKDETVVKYSVLNNSAQMFASKYLPYLPSEEELKNELEERSRLLLSARENE